MGIVLQAIAAINRFGEVVTIRPRTPLQELRGWDARNKNGSHWLPFFLLLRFIEA